MNIKKDCTRLGGDKTILPLHLHFMSDIRETILKQLRQMPEGIDLTHPSVQCGCWLLKCEGKV